MRLGKLAVAGLAFAALATVFAGCVHFQSGPTVKQVGKKPKVKVKFEVCAEGSAPENPCQPASNSDEASLGAGRLLVGFRVPKGTKTPDTFRPKTVAGAAGFTPGSSAKLHRNDLYTSELNQLAPKGPKYKWVGYQSDPIRNDDEEPVPFLEGTFKVKLGLPQDYDKKKFKVRPVIGGVADLSNPDFELPDCGSSPYELQDDGDVAEWICIDDPSPSEVETNLKVKIKQKKN
jgi:hypothetical protein